MNITVNLLDFLRLLHKVSQRRHQEPQRLRVTLCILGGSLWYGYTKSLKEGTKNRKDFVLLYGFLVVLCGMVTQSFPKKMALRTSKLLCYSVYSWWFSVVWLHKVTQRRHQEPLRLGETIIPQ